jgi:hypothetical protein
MKKYSSFIPEVIIPEEMTDKAKIQSMKNKVRHETSMRKLQMDELKRWENKMKMNEIKLDKNMFTHKRKSKDFISEQVIKERFSIEMKRHALNQKIDKFAEYFEKESKL